MTTAPPAPARERLREKLNLRRRLADYYRRLLESPGKIDEVAGGFALGIFFGFSPWHGFHFLLTLAFCVLLRRSLAAGIIGAATFNVFTAVPIFALELKLGRLLLGGPPMTLPELSFNLKGLGHLYRSGATVFYPYLTGSVIVGGVAAAGGYLWLRTSLRAYRRRVYLRRKDGPDA